jgi:hypothetical protein
MTVSAVVFLGKPEKKRLGEQEEFDMEARRRELEKAVDELRSIVPNATFTLFISSLSAVMEGSEEDVEKLQRHFAGNADAGSIVKDRPDMMHAAD